MVVYTHKSMNVREKNHVNFVRKILKVSKVMSKEKEKTDLHIVLQFKLCTLWFQTSVMAQIRKTVGFISHLLT